MRFFRQIKGLPDDSDTKIGFFELWSKVFLNYVRKDSSDYAKMRPYNLYSNDSNLYSEKDYVSFFYTIDGYPTQLPIDFKKALRKEIRGKVRLSFISTFERNVIQWNSPQMRSKMRTWKTIDEEEMGGISAFNFRENMDKLGNNEWRKASLMYLAKADGGRDRKLFKYRTMMVVSGNRGRGFDATIDALKIRCSNMGLKITRIDSNISEFLKAFSPFSLELSSNILKQCGNTTIPDEILSRFSTYMQGKVGTKGIYWGTDIESGLPVFKQMKRTGVEAENILISAETGGGKSYFLKMLLLQLLGENNFTGTIMDIEGNEYTPLAYYTANNDMVVILNMAEGEGKYFDPVEINLVGDKELDADMFSFSKSFTLSILKVLVGGTFIKSNPWASIIINDAVAKTYHSVGVSEDMDTWSNSKGLTLFDVYYSMKDMYNDVVNKDGSRKDLGGLYSSMKDTEDKKLLEMYKENKGYRDALDLVVASLSRFFEPLENGGTSSHIFQEKVSVEDIKDAKLVVCSFGMRGKSANMIDPIHLALTQLSASNISYMRSIFAQSKEKFNFKVWEEFQRWGSLPDSEKTIKTALTGGRKLGDVNFIVTNNLKELLEEDKFALFDNTTTFAIGAIDNADTRKTLCDKLSIPLLRKELDRLVVKKGSNKSFGSGEMLSSKYDKAFLVRLDKSVSTFTRMELPEEIAKSSIFKTGINIDESTDTSNIVEL